MHRPAFCFVFALAAISIAHAAASDASADTFLWIAVILIAARIASLVERFGQPAVLGELLIGVALGNLSLIGVNFFEPLISNPILFFLAQLGVVILLFQIGLESDLESMRRVGSRALFVAMIGVGVPFVLGAYVIGPWLLPGSNEIAHLFLGAALTATSVGITGRVFRDFGALNTPAAHTVLGAAVIDDVLGLIILAVVSAIATTGEISGAELGKIVFEALAFLVGAIVIGQLTAPHVSRLFAKIQTGTAMKFALVICPCLILAYLAHVIGLAPIIGAFAAGLILDEVQFRQFDPPDIHEPIKKAVRGADEETVVQVEEALDRYTRHDLERLIEPVGHFFVPIFFVLTGMQVKLDVVFNAKVLLIVVAVTAAAIVGKLVSGLAAGAGDKWLVGWGMVPRGEVGLIFASIGISLGAINQNLFSIIVTVVILTTLLTPPVLAALLRGR
jgi:Kef-type K+ transport system membrane component KefB